MLPWIPLLAAGMNPEETPLFREELTGETHKAKGERVRGGEEWSGRRRRRGEGGAEVVGLNLVAR